MEGLRARDQCPVHAQGRNRCLRKRPFPTFASEAEYDEWLQSADLTEYDASGFRETNVEAMIKNRSVTLRMPEYLFAALRAAWPLPLVA